MLDRHLSVLNWLIITLIQILRRHHWWPWARPFQTIENLSGLTNKSYWNKCEQLEESLVYVLVQFEKVASNRQIPLEAVGLNLWWTGAVWQIVLVWNGTKPSKTISWVWRKGPTQWCYVSWALQDYTHWHRITIIPIHTHQTWICNEKSRYFTMESSFSAQFPFLTRQSKVGD